MQEKNMRFGEFIKTKRLKDSRELTLRDISQALGLSLSLLSDIEQGRRKPFDSDKIEAFCDYLHLSDDLAAKDRGEIPSDIEDITMYSKVGDMARFALRMTNAGFADEEDWKVLIQRINEKRGKTSD